MDEQFLVELSRRIKRHPQSYPTWMVQLAEDVMLTSTARRMERPEIYGDPEQRFAKRVLSGEA